MTNDLIRGDVLKLPPRGITRPKAANRPLPSLSLEGKHVQTIGRSLWPHARTGDALSKGGAGLGRAHWLGASPGQKLAPDGLWMPVAVGWFGSWSRLAFRPGHHYAMGRGGRPSRSGASCRSGKSCLSADRSTNRFPPRALHRACASLPDRRHRAAAGLAPRLRLHDRSWRRGAERLRPRATIPFAKLGNTQIAVEVSSVIRASPDSFPRRLDRTPLRQRSTCRDRALDRDPLHRHRNLRATPIDCARTRSAFTSTPSTGRRSSASDAVSLHSCTGQHSAEPCVSLC